MSPRSSSALLARGHSFAHTLQKEITTDDKFLILASRGKSKLRLHNCAFNDLSVRTGLWDVLSSSDACQIVRKHINQLGGTICRSSKHSFSRVALWQT